MPIDLVLPTYTSPKRAQAAGAAAKGAVLSQMATNMQAALQESRASERHRQNLIDELRTNFAGENYKDYGFDSKEHANLYVDAVANKALSEGTSKEQAEKIVEAAVADQKERAGRKRWEAAAGTADTGVLPRAAPQQKAVAPGVEGELDGLIKSQASAPAAAGATPAPGAAPTAGAAPYSMSSDIFPAEPQNARTTMFTQFEGTDVAPQARALAQSYESRRERLTAIPDPQARTQALFKLDSEAQADMVKLFDKQQEFAEKGKARTFEGEQKGAERANKLKIAMANNDTKRRLAAQKADAGGKGAEWFKLAGPLRTNAANLYAQMSTIEQAVMDEQIKNDKKEGLMKLIADNIIQAEAYEAQGWGEVGKEPPAGAAVGGPGGLDLSAFEK